MDVRFTVVTVVFNAEDVLRKTIESVLNQEYLPYEYLIFDGCSKDRSVQIAREYADAFEKKGVIFRVVSEKDTGIYNAMNKGVKAATGDFISFLNAGDWYEKDALKNVRDFYTEAPFELTYGGLHYVHPNGVVKVKMSKLDSFPISSRHWNHPSMFLKRELYQKYGFDEQFRAYADFDLYLKLRKDKISIRVIDKVIASFVADGISTNTDLRKVLSRAGEKYRAYRHNGYSTVYWIEAYGWEIIKAAYFKLFKG